jgi:putative endonuclease
MKKSELGKKGEDQASAYLKENHFKILERNYRSRYGEIDVIAREGNTIVFVEVKLRTTDQFGSPLAAVDQWKQKRLRRMAASYLQAKGLYDRAPVRFDVLGITPAGIEHIKNAF